MPGRRKSPKFLVLGGDKKDRHSRPRTSSRKHRRARPRSRKRSGVRKTDHVVVTVVPVPVSRGPVRLPSPRTKKNTCCSGINAVLWIVTILAITLVAATLIIFHKDIFGSGNAPGSGNSSDLDSESSEIDSSDPEAAKRRREKEEERERKRRERDRLDEIEIEREREKKRRNRQAANKRSLTASDFELKNVGFRGTSVQERIRVAEEQYDRLTSSAILKRDREKLWAVALILYTNKGADGINHPFYSTMNASLREGESTYKKYAEIVNDALNYLIEEQSIEVPETLYRGISLPPDIAKKAVASNGQLLGKGNQFSSTTTDRGVAEHFARWTSGNQAFVLEIENCTHAAMIKDYGLKGEEEWLIPYQDKSGYGIKFKTSLIASSYWSSEDYTVNMKQISKSNDG